MVKESHATPARLCALSILREVRERTAFASEVMRATIPQAGLSRSDEAFTRKLVVGVVSTVGTLDEIINANLRSPRDIKPKLRDALRISTFEIIFLSKADHAVVNEGVELARAAAPKAAGLANAVLRKILAYRDVFPGADPSVDEAALARLHGFPYWLEQVLSQQIGRDATEAFLQACDDPAPLYLAINSLKTDKREVQAALFAEGIETLEVGSFFRQGTEMPLTLRLANRSGLGSPVLNELIADGKVTVSDASAQAISRLTLPATPPDSMLEVCSGRGTKTIQIQSNANQIYGHQIPLTCVDIHAFKEKILKQRCAAYGVDVQDVVTMDATLLHEHYADSFDCVFVDAPCSGVGTLRRHPEIRWRLTPDDIVSVAQTARGILDSAARCVKVGGVIGYATCSPLSLEDESLVKGFFESDFGSNFAIQAISRGVPAFKGTLVPDGPDAHFFIRLIRTR